MTGSPPQQPNTSSQPLVIDQDDHPIRQDMIDKDAVYVMRKLNKAGFSSYLVGGGVRDLYLKAQPKDFDISTDARPGQIRKLFPNSSTIGRRFRLVQVFFKGGKVIEVSTLRSHSEHDLDGPEAVLAPNNTFGNLPEDAQRRDLSINSLFFELEHKTIIDYVGGVQDLDNSVIRILGNPDKRVNRDPVRMMRAIRHSARTGFTIEDKTWQSIASNCEKIIFCPPSRIRDELFKDLYGGSAASWFDLMVESELFFTLFPFYRDILFTSPPEQLCCREQLHNIFNTFDDIYRHHSPSELEKLPKYFVLALLILPWAESAFNLSRLKLKGPGYFQLSKSLRAEIDNVLGKQLNLRRSLRQEMVTLLSNLPRFVHLVQTNPPPRWLKGKSYYDQCLLFYQFQQVALADNHKGRDLHKLTNNISPRQTDKSSRKQPLRRKTKPAFSPRKKGGIFGFRK